MKAKTAYFLQFCTCVLMSALLLCLFSTSTKAAIKTGGTYEISGDSINLAGSFASGATYIMLYSAGQPSGSMDSYNAGANLQIETGFVGGIEAVFSQFDLTSVASAPVVFGYLGLPSDPVPGARVTYTLYYTNSGEAAINNSPGPGMTISHIVIDNQIPTDIDFEPGTIKLNTVSQTDADDFPGTDACTYNSGTKKVTCIVLMLAGQTGTIEFSGIIK